MSSMKHIYTGVLSVSLLLLVRSSIALSFEHSFDGVKFTDAGSLMGDMYKDSTLELQRLPASEKELAQLHELISRDGFYTVKVSSNSGLPVTASVRASCLSSEALSEQATVHIDEHGAVVSLTYSITSPSCGSAPSPATPSSTAPHPLTHLSRPLTVVIDTPTFAPVLESTVAPPPPLSGPSALLNNFGASLESAISGGGGSAGAAAAKGDGKVPPVPDNRSWLAKNWMFVLGACMMAFNIITRTSGAPAAAAARPAAVAAAPRR